MRISDWSSDVCSSDLAVAGFTGHRARHADLRGLAAEGVFEGDLHVVAKVGTTRRLAAALPAHEVAEHLVEDVGDAAGREALEDSADRRLGAIGHGSMSHPVVARPLIVVLMHLLDFVDLLTASFVFSNHMIT